MLEKLKTYLGITGTEKDDLLNLIISQAQDYAREYCHLAVYDAKLDYAVLKMAVEDYNRYQSEGITSRSYSGISEAAAQDYSPQTVAALNKHRRVRFI